jgi:hypothetical protein
VTSSSAGESSGGSGLEGDGSHAGTGSQFPLALERPLAALLRDSMFDFQAYLEWGSGGSTLVAVQSAIPRIVSVESSPEWLERMCEHPSILTAVNASRLTFECPDLGPTRGWGYPVHDIGRRRASEYHLSPVLQALDESPNGPWLCLVDGRYRVACAMAAVGLLPANSLVIVDDYERREHYHVVEEVMESSRMIGRAVVLEVPKDVNPTWAQIWSAHAKDPR